MPITKGDPEGLVRFDALGEAWTAVFGFRAMKAAEAHYDLPFFQVVQKIMPSVSPEDAGDRAKIAAAAASLRFTDVGHMFGFALQKHHPGLTEDAVDDLIDEIGLSRASEIIGQALSSAMAEEGDEDSAKGPRKPRRSSRTG